MYIFSIIKKIFCLERSGGITNNPLDSMLKSTYQIVMDYLLSLYLLLIFPTLTQ